MLPDFWELVVILIAASSLAIDFLNRRDRTKPRSADEQRTRVAVRVRVREVRLGRWVVWRSSERHEDFDRS